MYLSLLLHHMLQSARRGHGYWAGLGRTSGLAGWALGWSCCAGHQVALRGAATALSSCRAQQLRSVPALSSPGILESVVCTGTDYIFRD